ncbi:MAG: MoxR family ATPase [Planctomycetia bacterium]|nr:MoxR family ATPase [Planctomycetia bacterium]
MLTRLQQHIESVFLGQTQTIQLCLTAFLTGEHLLLEDVPGVGKTLLARTLARCVNAEFHRIQFTPDLLPAEITGSSLPVLASASVLSGKISENIEIYGNSENTSVSEERQKNLPKTWQFLPGPIFANIVLADEINRATPRTQSALLEAMGENSVTTDGVTRALPDPFFVIATQNPVEFEGTFPLPESQLDRFLMRLSLGYAPRKLERELLSQHFSPERILQPILTLDDVRELQEQARNVMVEETIVDYMMDLAEATRRDPACRVGISTRGLQAFYRASQAWALVQGRNYVIPDDVKFLAVPVLAHRILLKSSYRQETRKNAEEFIKKIIERILIP